MTPRSIRRAQERKARKEMERKARKEMERKVSNAALQAEKHVTLEPAEALDHSALQTPAAEHHIPRRPPVPKAEPHHP